jgi:hypothetical protein
MKVLLTAAFAFPAQFGQTIVLSYQRNLDVAPNESGRIVELLTAISGFMGFIYVTQCPGRQIWATRGRIVAQSTRHPPSPTVHPPPANCQTN